MASEANPFPADLGKILFLGEGEKIEAIKLDRWTPWSIAKDNIDPSRGCIISHYDKKTRMNFVTIAQFTPQKKHFVDVNGRIYPTPEFVMQFDRPPFPSQEETK